MSKIPPQNLEAESSLLGALLLDKETIIKTMNYDNYKSKQTTKQLSKQKVQDKLDRKNNVITLQYGKSIKYLNSKSTSVHWKNTKVFLVGGYFKQQPYGKRSEGKTYRKWIKPFWKGKKNSLTNCIDKVYKVA